MGGMSPETHWASHKYEIKFWYTVASCWIFYVKSRHSLNQPHTTKGITLWAMAKTGKTQSCDKISSVNKSCGRKMFHSQLTGFHNAGYLKLVQRVRKWLTELQWTHQLAQHIKDGWVSELVLKNRVAKKMSFMMYKCFLVNRSESRRPNFTESEF
jgi:hypothetical protein